MAFGSSIVFEREEGLIVSETVPVLVLRARDDNGRREVYTTALTAEEVAAADVVRPSWPRLHRAAREVFAFLGSRPGGYVMGHDKVLLGIAVRLLELADELREEAA